MTPLEVLLAGAVLALLLDATLVRRELRQVQASRDRAEQAIRHLVDDGESR